MPMLRLDRTCVILLYALLLIPFVLVSKFLNFICDALTAMTGSTGNTNTACAACKFQRRKCSADCPLSPYFPPDQPKRFANVHKLFGVSNILRILKFVDPSKREDTVKSIAYEADTREKDPVHGCLGVITVLQNQVSKLKEELNMAGEQLFLVEQQQAVASAGQQLQSFHGHPGLSRSSVSEDEESQFLRHQISFHDDHKFDTKFNQKSNILPLNYRYGADDASSVISLLNVDHVEQLRRAGSYFGMDPSYDESPVSHHQMHMQAVLEQDHFHALRSSPPDGLSAYGIAPEGVMRRTNYLVTSGQCKVSDHDLQRAGVYLTLTNQH
nr:uncharacterized protein LOC112276598 isoform X1 [Physcomitrium patens]XP_024363799.1 uncharacterized protein LOC112276598 isoform X1 [Physcomitrium patens]|eukprot:XP_024363798.1 uncharacterized protein LOC112276598 isoform X1 [Physcomitrella patens]